MGTPSYSSPEGIISAKSDLFSLGVLAYLLLDLSLPFINPSNMNLIRKEEPILIQRDVSQQLLNLVMVLLMKDPNLRLSLNEILALDVMLP
jgi:serine/threonine protein kinase